MPRLARKNLYSNFIHLIVQGINQEYIFEKKEWKTLYLNILKNKLTDLKVEILAYCIMGNHAHFLVYYENMDDLLTLMRKVNTTYAMYYNKFNKRKGYVFRDRYFSQSITTENQLYNCIVYIHNNPVAAGLVLNYLDYQFSSFREYVNPFYRKFITSKGLTLLFGNDTDYIDLFNLIHAINYNINDIADTMDTTCTYQDVIAKYETDNLKSLDEIKKEPMLFGNLLLELRKVCGLSLREMSSIFNLNKDKLNTYIHIVIDAEKR